MPAPSPQTAAIETPTTPPKRRGKRILVVVIVLAVLGVGGGGGWWWWLQQAHASANLVKKAASTARLPAHYYAMEPAFVVNLADQDSVRYLQADLQLMTRDPDTLAAFETHAPAIRNRLLLLFGQESAEGLAGRRGKERLQAAALTEVRQVLKAEGAADKVEAVMFTSLVTQ